MTGDLSPDKERITIVLHSGSYDRASYALSIALVALASGMEVHMLLTFDGLRRFTKGHLGDTTEHTSQDVKENIELGLESGAVQPIETQLANAKQMGLKLYACPNAIAALNIDPGMLLEEIDSIMGLASFLAIARTAAVNWYI